MFQGFLSDDWMFYFASQDVSLFDYNPASRRLEFVGVCGYFVFLKTLVQQRIAFAVKDSALPLLFIFRELDPLCTVSFENCTIPFTKTGRCLSSSSWTTTSAALRSTASSGRPTNTTTSPCATKR